MAQHFIGQLNISRKTTLEWKIQRIGSCLNNNTIFNSPEFSINYLKWQLSFAVADDNVLSLHLKSPGRTFTTNASFSIVNKQGRKLYQRIIGISEFSTRDAFDISSHGMLFITKIDLLSRKDIFLSNDELTIQCELFPGEFNIQKETWFNFHEVLTGKNTSDFQLIVGGYHLYAHKVVLARASEVFAMMFEHNFVENTRNSVIIEDIEYEVAVEMLRFMYTGEVKSIKKVAENLLIAADKYALFDLKDTCVNYLHRSITQENAIQYLDLAIRHDCKSLKDSARLFILQNSNQITYFPEYDSILNLQDDTLVDIIRDLSKKSGCKHQHK